MLDDPTECYKFYWLEFILQLLAYGKDEITFDDSGCKFEIPIKSGKITRFRKGNTTYIRYVTGRIYHPEKKYNVPDHKIIGKLISEESSLGN